MPVTIFITEENKLPLKNDLLTWLEDDFNHRNQPERHFWHNDSLISDAFDRCSALVVLDDNREMMGFMTWSIVGIRAEIHIIYVYPKYSKQGLCKKMLEEFIKQYIDVSVLTGHVLPESEEIFLNMGGTCVPDINGNRLFYKVVRPVLQPIATLSDGCVIAIHSKAGCNDTSQGDEFHSMQNIPEKHPQLYFNVKLNAERKLSLPIITPFHYEDIIGVYFNQELIAEGKAEHLFINAREMCDSGLLILASVEPIENDLFNKKGFFAHYLIDDSRLKSKTETAQVPYFYSQSEAFSFFSNIENNQEIILPSRPKDEFNAYLDPVVKRVN